MDDILYTIGDLNRQIALYESNRTTNSSSNFTDYDHDHEYDYETYSVEYVDNITDQMIESTECFTEFNITTISKNDHPWPITVQLLLILLYFCTVFLSLFGNICVILVHHAYRHSLLPFENIRICVLNLAASDIITGVLCAPFMYVDNLMDKWIFPQWLCPVVQYAQLVSIFVTTNTLMIIGLERCTALFCPFSNFYRQLKSITPLLAVFTWICGFIYGLIPFISANWDQTTTNSNINTLTEQCANFATFTGANRKLLITTNFVLTFAIPLVGLIVTYTAIMVKLILNEKRPIKNGNGNTRTQPFPQPQQQPQQQLVSLQRGDSTVVINNSRQTILTEYSRTSHHNNKNSSKTIRITFVIILLFGLCWTPIKLYQLLHEYGYISYCTEAHYRTQLYIYICLHWLAMANTFMNPIVYTFASRRFRNCLRKIVKSVRCELVCLHRL